MAKRIFVADDERNICFLIQNFLEKEGYEVTCFHDGESILKACEEQMPDIVEHIDAIEADEMISDNLAMATVMFESPAGHGKQGIVNIGHLSRMFDADDVITLSVLKEKGIVHKNIGRLKVLADGVLDKPFTIKAESYSIQAIKMIELTGGKVIILKD